MPQFLHSGYAIADEVRRLEPRFTIDVGCGHNEFKSLIGNLIGIDIANDAADLVCDFADAPVAASSIDCILALGSINFGDESLIGRQLRTLCGWLTDSGVMFMRANPGFSVDELPVYPWSVEGVDRMGQECGLVRQGPVQVDTLLLPSGVREERLVWRYVRRSGAVRAKSRERS